MNKDCKEIRTHHLATIIIPIHLDHCTASPLLCNESFLYRNSFNTKPTVGNKNENAKFQISNQNIRNFLKNISAKIFGILKSF